jgi:hypothetical protein
MLFVEPVESLLQCLVILTGLSVQQPVRRSKEDGVLTSWSCLIFVSSSCFIFISSSRSKAGWVGGSREPLTGLVRLVGVPFAWAEETRFCMKALNSWRMLGEGMEWM